MATPIDRASLLADLHRDRELSRPRRLVHGAILPRAHLDLEGFAVAASLADLHLPALRGLWLGDCALGPEAAGDLADLLARHPRLEHLSLRGNPLGGPALQFLLPGFAAHSALRALDLGDTALDATSICQIGHALEDTSIGDLRFGGGTHRLDLAATDAWAVLLARARWHRLALPAAPEPERLLAALDRNTSLCALDLGDLAPDLRQRLLARLCRNANRQPARRPAADLARLRRALPPVEPPPELPAPLTDADLDVALRVLSNLSLRPSLVRSDHPRLAELRRALFGFQRDERRSARVERRRDHRRREAQQAEDRRRIDDAAIRRREQGVATAPPEPAEPTIHELHTARPCYVCKQLYTGLHFFYDRLCPVCAARSYARRSDVLDLRGRVALVTGGRIKIGHHVALRLLRWGARVLVTSRFPRDTARRFAAQPDFAEFRERLEIFGLDLRQIPRVEAFAARLTAELPALDILVNNAAQTVHRPPEFYAALLADEARPDALPPALQSLLPEPHVPGDILPAEHPLFPQHSDDGFGQPLDLRERNSWRLRLDEVGTIEMVEVQLINTVAPFVLNARLRRLMARAAGAAFIVNVSAPEGRFDRDWKSPHHPHTNMAKAALNMMTRTAAEDYAADRIYMTSVDTGWASNENPAPIAEAMRERGFTPPLDLVDAAARVCDPIVRGLRDGEFLRGIFLKDFEPISW
ncbi:SDR family NAD(P)-dependent oxidoreductase [Nannocystis sp. SCPEA4]|uniref:SDR family NAD(P)-dependent oxidoreductase n=1 Tax=Nannocystis sp. SCPEA4 TaxID=2996787 RepID=UPI00226DA06C|nr:SDR family NAD(P)-dependent oxidoreductase [Nannocystis sp. SCPEA4]MCY1060871.1 SDR family NAD(P)-dependent oxidoreductase [Nannocystis sp. SCPEA4]